MGLLDKASDSGTKAAAPKAAKAVPKAVALAKPVKAAKAVKAAKGSKSGKGNKGSQTNPQHSWIARWLRNCHTKFTLLSLVDEFHLELWGALRGPLPLSCGFNTYASRSCCIDHADHQSHRYTNHDRSHTG